MMSPETNPAMFPFATAVWQSHLASPSLHYRTMVFSPQQVYSISPAKRQLPRRHHRNGTSSFSINAILGLQQETDTKDVDPHDVHQVQARVPAVCEFAIRREFGSAAGVKQPSGHRLHPGAHLTYLPVSNYLASPLEVGRTVSRFDTNEGLESRHISGNKEKDFDLEFLEKLEATSNDRKIGLLDRDNICSGSKRPGPPLGWLSELPEQASSKPKRVRTIFTQDQLDRLEKEFARQQYMVGTERLYLAAQLDLTESQVKVWFQNRRIKWRKQHLESQQEKLAQYRAQREKERQDSVDKDGEMDGSPLSDSEGNAMMNDDERREVRGDNKTSPDGEEEETANKTELREQAAAARTGHQISTQSAFDLSQET